MSCTLTLLLLVPYTGEASVVAHSTIAVCAEFHAHGMHSKQTRTATL